MDIAVFTPAQFPTALRVLRTALSPDDSLDRAELLFLTTLARIWGAPEPGPRLETQPADTVAMHGRRQRRRLVQLAALAALLHRPVRASAACYLRALATQLSIDDPAVDVVEALAAGRRRRARLLTMRRAFPALYGDAFRAEGIAGVLRFAAALLFRLPVNTEQRWAFKRLGLLPEGTLGREYWRHMTTVGFGLPGEPGGITAAIAYHDLGHVLAEHETTPLGEIQQGSFQAGNRRADGYFFAQFVVLQFHQGVRITPGTPATVGAFDPEKVLWAIHRGACCREDLTRRWNFWPLLPLCLDEARARLGLLPKLPPWRAPSPRAAVAAGARP